MLTVAKRPACSWSFCVCHRASLQATCYRALTTGQQPFYVVSETCFQDTIVGCRFGYELRSDQHLLKVRRLIYNGIIIIHVIIMVYNNSSLAVQRDLFVNLVVL